VTSLPVDDFQEGYCQHKDLKIAFEIKAAIFFGGKCLYVMEINSEFYKSMDVLMAGEWVINELYGKGNVGKGPKTVFAATSMDL